MARKSRKKPIEQYDHKGKKRVNNPPVGLVTPETDKDSGKKTYEYDPHLDPSLQWTGKAEHTSFEVSTVSLHVHERIDPRTIIEAVQKKGDQPPEQGSLFALPDENPPLREAIEFYKHSHNWSNRLIAGDSLEVMNSLIEKEGLAGQVQMVYMDPPYGIKYGSNFQPFVNKREVKDGSDSDLSQEPEMIKAFRDTWELGIHSYLNYLRDRLLLSHALISESGSIFLQIGDENVHHAREVMDEIFGSNNFIAEISFLTTTGRGSRFIDSVFDTLIWYGKNKEKTKYRQLFLERTKDMLDARYKYYEDADGSVKRLSQREMGSDKYDVNRRFRLSGLTSQGTTKTGSLPFEFNGEIFEIGKNQHWKTTKEGLRRLKDANRLAVEGKSLVYKRFVGDFPFYPLRNVWTDTGGGALVTQKIYVVQTTNRVIERCIQMATDPGDLVIDPTCGSGTTSFVAEQWGRRWITCDTSRVAIALAKQRLMTASYRYYRLAQPDEGVDSGFEYEKVPRGTLKSIANNEQPSQEILYDRPYIDNSKARITGPFTVEAVPSPVVKPFAEIEEEVQPDDSIAHSGETIRDSEWRDELLKTGIRAKGSQFINFSRVEPLPGTRWLHAEAETKPDVAASNGVKEAAPEYVTGPERVVVSFGPEHAPLEQRQVALAIEEAQTLVPKPKIIVFAAFQFDPEAAKDIDETDWPGVTLLKAQMNADLLTEDLKKKRASNESFWLIGQPDVTLSRATTEDEKDKYQVEVHGFDYYNTLTGTIDSGGSEKIAMWMLDTDYDGRSLFPRQVFFPMAGKNEGWSRLAKNLKAEIAEDLIEAYRGTVSLPFKLGENKRVAVKIIDDRGIESLKIIEAD